MGVSFGVCVGVSTGVCVGTFSSPKITGLPIPTSLNLLPLFCINEPPNDTQFIWSELTWLLLFLYILPVIVLLESIWANRESASNGSNTNVSAVGARILLKLITPLMLDALI